MAWSRTDDLDGTPAEQSLFGFDGQMYMIDLGPDSLEKMRKALQPFLTVAQLYGDMPTPEDVDSQMVDVSPPPTPAPRVPAEAKTPGNGTRKGGRGRPAKGPALSVVGAKTTGSNGKPDFKSIRAWANENGYSVGPTGRIPAWILRAYDTQTPAG